jgi:hypothetical protein
MVAPAKGGADHVTEDLGAGRLRRRVEGGHAQRMPQQAAQFFRLAVGELAHAQMIGGVRAVQQAMRPACGGQLFAPAQPLGAEQPRQQVQRRRQTRAGEAEIRRLVQGERQAPAAGRCWDAGGRSAAASVQAPEQDVLAVVEHLAFERPPVHVRRGAAGCYRVTATPASARVSAAAQPAQPPPTTATRFHGDSQVLPAATACAERRRDARATRKMVRRISSGRVQ